MTVLEIGTSLPELSSHLVAHSEYSLAPSTTLVGSNIVNPLVGIGLGGVLSTYSVPSAVVLWDLPFKLIAGVGLLGLALHWREEEFTRTEGGYVLGLYFAFLAGRLLLFSGQ